MENKEEIKEEKIKEEEIKKALKFHVETQIPGSVTEKAEWLNDKVKKFSISKGEISRMLHLKLLPSLEKIMKIELALGVDIIFANYPRNYYEREKDDTSNTIYSKIRNQFKNFEKLEQCLKEKFQTRCKQIEYNFVLRKRQDYLSANLVPSGKEIGGYHILFFRYNESKEQLIVQFIVPDEVFEKEKKRYDLEDGGTMTTYLPLKKLVDKQIIPHQKCSFPGQPWRDISDLRQTTIDDVCNAAIEVYNKQSSDSPLLGNTKNISVIK